MLVQLSSGSSIFHALQLESSSNVSRQVVQFSVNSMIIILRKFVTKLDIHVYYDDSEND